MREYFSKLEIRRFERLPRDDRDDRDDSKATAFWPSRILVLSTSDIGRSDMKFKMTSLLLFIAFSSAFSLAENPVNYRYTGDSVGRQVCRSIVRDDVNKLKKVLKFHRQRLGHAVYTSGLASQAIVGSFKCNALALQDFSYEVGSQNVLRYLTTDRGTVEEQVVSTGK